MPDSASQTAPALSRGLLAAIGAAALLVASTLVLWAHYGSAVFYEMIAAGIAACF
ncbi:MAG TPA: hypothetical protein VHA77_12560 [Xanthobacteraceae bacterium]|jgi:hypothetical protein|nr:hypothetical protein [Xanthobacteraceae bacterium]